MASSNMNESPRTVGERRRGFASLLVALASLVVLGMLGLAADLGRMYVAKNELQNYTDASSIAAAAKLNGTLAGIAAATARATNDVNRWNFGTESVGAVTVEFATVAAGPYEANPLIGSGYRFVRVLAEGPVPIYFMRAFPGVGASFALSANSVAGQQLMGSVGDNLLPFSPDAHDPADPTGNYGFLLGRQYTLKYEKRTGNSGAFLTSINGTKLIGCEADMSAPGFAPGETSSSQRGYVDLGDLDPLDPGGGASLIKDLILGKTSFAKSITPFQYWITPEPGQKQTAVGTLRDRVAQQDTDAATATYYTQPQTSPGTPSPEVMNSLYRSAYAVDEPRPPNGNGRRLVVVPVNDPNAAGLVIGFAGFFLPPDPCAQVRIGNKNYEPCCGEYVGAVTPDGVPAAGPPGSYQVVLVQ